MRDLLDQVVRLGRTVSTNLAVNRWMKFGMVYILIVLHDN